MLTMTMKRFQMNLKFLGYYGGEIDGIKGNQTIDATKRFQEDNGLVVDGIIGQNTIDCMRNIICAKQREVGATEDGVAGDETITKSEEHNCNEHKEEQYTWDNVKYFKQSEFACKCGCGFDSIDLRLVKICDEIREHFNSPMIITSGCRCANHNSKVGGVQGSRHVLAKAVDFYIQNVSISDIMNYTNELVAEGKLRYTYTGKYSNGNMTGAVHIDIQ